jgi:hypothetical protein
MLSFYFFFVIIIIIIILAINLNTYTYISLSLLFCLFSLSLFSYYYYYITNFIGELFIYYFCLFEFAIDHFHRCPYVNYVCVANEVLFNVLKSEAIKR